MKVDDLDLLGSRRTLHAVAEYLLAGPQYALSRTIRLRVSAGGFETVAPPELRIDGCDLVTPTGRHSLATTCAELAAAAGLETRELRDVYAQGPVLAVGDPLHLDPDAVGVILTGFAMGDTALRAFRPDVEPVLWPEHFDLAITAEEVNYGVSAGDEHLPIPYAYVGPWAAREGRFWNVSFGAARPMSDLPDVASLVDFFRNGAQAAADDPPRDP